MRASHLPENRRLWRNNRRNMLIDLLGGVCIECGTTENIEFDHVIPEDKSFELAVNLEQNIKNILPELQKCQLLCKSHHILKSISDRDFKNPEHGTPSTYTNHGCRCDLCRSAWANDRRKYQKDLRLLRRCATM